MSAYIVPDRHINYLVSYALARKLYMGGKRLEIEDDGQPVAQMLLDANYASVNARYRENDTGTIKFDQTFEDFVPLQVLKACDAYDYQACEVEAYKRTPAATFINTVRGSAIRELPGYSEAVWGAPEAPDVKRVSLCALARGLP